MICLLDCIKINKSKEYLLFLIYSVFLLNIDIFKCMVITFTIKFLVLLLIHGVILPCPVKCYSAKFFNDNSDFYKKYFMKHYNLNYKLPLDYQYYHDIKNIDDFPVPELLVKNIDDHDKYGEGIGINEVIKEPLEPEAIKRSLLGNKRNNSLKLKLLNQGARGFGRK